MIKVTFPAGFNLQPTSVYVTSFSGIDGNFTPSAAGQIVMLTRHSGTATAASSTIVIVLGGIENPAAVGMTGPFMIAVYGSDGVTEMHSDAGIPGVYIGTDTGTGSEQIKVSFCFRSRKGFRCESSANSAKSYEIMSL